MRGLRVLSTWAARSRHGAFSQEPPGAGSLLNAMSRGEQNANIVDRSIT
jgi:hypothetical protein